MPQLSPGRMLCTCPHPPLCLPTRLPACSTLRLWDPRQGAAAGALVARLQLPSKVFTMSLAGDSRLVVGMGGRQVDIFDLRT